MGCIIATENRKCYFWNVLYHNMKLSLCHMIYTEYENWIQSVLVMSLHAKLLIFSTCDFRSVTFIRQKWARSFFVPQLNKASREKVLPMSQVWNRGCAADSATDSTKKGARFSFFQCLGSSCLNLFLLMFHMEQNPFTDWYSHCVCGWRFIDLQLLDVSHYYKYHQIW